LTDGGILPASLTSASDAHKSSRQLSNIVQFAVQTNYFILKKIIMLLHFLQWKLAATMLYSLFKLNGYVIHD